MSELSLPTFMASMIDKAVVDTDANSTNVEKFVMKVEDQIKYIKTDADVAKTKRWFKKDDTTKKYLAHIRIANKRVKISEKPCKFHYEFTDKEEVVDFFKTAIDSAKNGEMDGLFKEYKRVVKTQTDT